MGHNFDVLITISEPTRQSPGKILFFLPTAQVYVKEIEDIKDSDAAMTKWRKEKQFEQEQRLMVGRLFLKPVIRA